ncbi:P-loop containing nucleoside triphosphate hydrolase protein [Delitschia confertaspora ATCC 74209]|uniref:DNA 3'-5' helicase n=1 Tax=Delitschia confertaspora ATCC 74209 TaxID=1513339 RepID=A0A9P4JQJ4_9PLEO|nr:P-loop containing nucleoside triphosphate hydrolase protein [Delitschia confertaspora ATCC 74209]
MDPPFHLRQSNPLNRGQQNEQYAQQSRQYTLTHPPFLPPAEREPSRDRYRVSRRYEDPSYDVVEDEERYEEEFPIDDFDRELLNRPYPDRQRQAEQGQARLSLASGPTRYFSGSSIRPQAHYPPYHEPAEERYMTAAPMERSQPRGSSLSRFAFNSTDGPEPSSESGAQGFPSSPAFRASQRRKEIHPSIGIRQAKSASQEFYTPPVTKTQKSRPTRFQKAIASHYGRLSPVASQDTFPSRDDACHRLEKTQKAFPSQINLAHSPPMAQGILLVPTTELPDRLRVVFPFPLFNAVQSRSFQDVYKSNDNFVLSSPTGSGKTAILELAICRAINNHTTGQYKIIYQAPTKSLCSERQRDWQKKFGPLGLECVEITGDSEANNLRSVQTASIIITTPEKWDIMTRKWKDHKKLMKLIKLFLIDEVHILKDGRGATLEAVVSRMKSMETYVRFVALSATIPNFEDVAIWLGKNSVESHEPAVSHKFGEEFRPVKLQKHVCGYQCNGNDFVFDKMLDSKLLEVIAKYSQRKPMMIFCMTRNATVSTAKALANWWATRDLRDRYWEVSTQRPQFEDKDLRDCSASGVAFHHAGLGQNDRLGVENGFLKGELNVICCTSTLAVGINLPCNFVIIKNTVAWKSTGPSEYPDLEIMQMLGRAGRPQFDDSAVAVIMTRMHKVRRYEQMVTGQDVLESSLHLNLIDHLNAEIGLGTISDLNSAKKWLAGTFLYVRLQQNPQYYKLEGSRSGQAIDEQLDEICTRDITLLQGTSLVHEGEHLRCTEFGDTMARYYVQFETMRGFVGLKPKSKISEILSALVQAAEFKEIRFRSGEKQLYKELNKNPSIRFPVPVDLALPAHKVSLILQSILGGVQIVWDNQTNKLKPQYNTELGTIFKHVHRLIRCIIDCQLCLEDSVSARNALMLERSLGARAWDDSPLQMRQVEQLGPVAVRKLATAGVRSIEELEATEPHRIEMILNRNPPFGMQVLNKLKGFPKLRVSVRVLPNTMSKRDDGVTVKAKVEIGFLNEKPPATYNKKLVMVSLLAETSDGRKMKFARISGQKLGNGQDLMFPVLLTNADQSINCYVMCDEIAGTMREATVKPKIGTFMFPVPKAQDIRERSLDRPTPNMSRRRSEGANGKRLQPDFSDEFGDDGLDDSDLVQAAVGDVHFDHIENYADPTAALTRKNTKKNPKGQVVTKPHDTVTEESNSIQLENGKWACNHKCKDKTICKHMCCREGVDRPRKARKRATASEDAPVQDDSNIRFAKQHKTQPGLGISTQKRGSDFVDVLDLTQQEKKRKFDTTSRDIHSLHQLDHSIMKKNPPKSISSVMNKKPSYCYTEGGQPNLSFMGSCAEETSDGLSKSDYGDFPSVSSENFSLHFPDLQVNHTQTNDDEHDDPDLDGLADDLPPELEVENKSETFGDAASLLGDSVIDMVDSHVLKSSKEKFSGQTIGRNTLPEPYETENWDTEEGYNHPRAVAALTDYPLFCGSDRSSSTFNHQSLPDKSRPSEDQCSTSFQNKVFKTSRRLLESSEANVRQQDLVSDTIEISTEEESHSVSENHQTDSTALFSVTVHDDVADGSVDLAGEDDAEVWFMKEFGDIVQFE